MKSKAFRITALLLLISFSILSFSCKKDDPSPNNSVSIVDDTFSPSSITVSKGTTITWTNNGSNTHTVTSDDALFDSGDLMNGNIYSRLFDSIGTFPYHCTHHFGMNGTVIVE